MRLAVRYMYVLVPLLFAVTSCSIIDRNEVILSDVAELEPEAVRTTESVGELRIRVLHKADYIVDERQTNKNFMVLTDADSYATELKKYSVEFPATVNFDSESVIVATMGTQVSGGFAVSATEAEEYTDKVIVRFELVSPADNCLTTQAESNPYEFALLPTKKSIEFVEVSRTQLCE